MSKCVPEVYEDLLLERWQFRSRRSRRRNRSTRQEIRKSLKGSTLIALAKRRHKVDMALRREWRDRIIEQFTKPNPLIELIPFIEVQS